MLWSFPIAQIQFCAYNKISIWSPFRYLKIALSFVMQVIWDIKSKWFGFSSLSAFQSHLLASHLDSRGYSSSKVTLKASRHGWWFNKAACAIITTELSSSGTNPREISPALKFWQQVEYRLSEPKVNLFSIDAFLLRRETSVSSGVEIFESKSVCCSTEGQSEKDELLGNKGAKSEIELWKNRKGFKL